MNAHPARPPAQPRVRAYAASLPMLRNRGLRSLFSMLPFQTPTPQATYLGWGYKPSGRKAQRLAAKTGGTALLVEEGFLTAGAPHQSPLQLLLDDTGGIHYDPAQPSLIDRVLQDAQNPEMQERAGALIDLIRQHGLSKTNDRWDPTPDAIPTQPFILVCDQVENDASLAPSRLTTRRFAAMLETTRRTWPDHLIVVRQHPRAHHGHYATLQPDNRLRLHPGTDHPAAWLQAADHVVVGSSQMGLEALIHGTPVTCWGTPFYAYRGLTRDFGAQPGYQRQTCDLETLVAAALILAPVSFDSLTYTPTTAEHVVHSLIAHRKARRLTQTPVRLVGVSARKRKHLQRFLPGLHTTNDPQAPTLAWGRAPGTIRVEDGFIRSRGLGAAFAPPLSWIFDTQGGIHTDPTQPSTCETILESTPLTPYLRARGKRLRAALRAQNVTKYNLAGTPAPYAKGYVLVLGQVESDASLLQAPIKTNQALLATVRAAYPTQTIVYRPHPDVVAGLRPGQVMGFGIADAVDTDSNLLDLLQRASVVHVNTSQGGLEALLHGKPVVTHGPAFYAGWGLTQDACHFSRRTRRLDLDTLCVLLYDVLPHYNDPTTGRALDVFQALEVLATTPTTTLTPVRRALGKTADAVRRWRLHG